MSLRRRDGIFLGAGASLALVVLLVLQSFMGSGWLSGKTVTSTTTAATSTIPDAYQQVANAYADHLLLLEARNVTGLMGGYEDNATIEWTGNMPDLVGTYNGSNEIHALLNDSFPGDMVNLTLSNETQTMAGHQGRYWVVNSVFEWAGYSSRCGVVNGKIAAQDSYVYSNEAWLIARETWNSLVYNMVFPSCQFP